MKILGLEIKKINKELYDKDSYANKSDISSDARDILIKSYEDFNWSFLSHNIQTAKSVDVLDTVLRFVGSYVSQMNIIAYDSNDNIIEHEILNLIKSPNQFDGQSKFISNWYYYLKTNGNCRVAKTNQSIINPYDVDLVLLNPDNETIYTPNKSIFDYDKKDFKVKYTEKTKNKNGFGKTFNTEFTLDELISFTDGIGESPLNSLHQEIKNINVAQRAKYNKLKLSGGIIGTPSTGGNAKEMTTEITDMLPVVDGSRQSHKDLAESRLRNSGIQGNDHVKIMTIPMEFSSLTKDLNDLDFDAEVLKDIITIYHKFGIPKFLIPYLDKDTTFDNQEKAMIDLIQSSVQYYGSIFTENLEKDFNLKEEGVRLKASFEHIPIYSKINKEKTDNINQQSEMYLKWLDKGIITKDNFIKKFEKWI